MTHIYVYHKCPYLHYKEPAACAIFLHSMGNGSRFSIYPHPSPTRHFVVAGSEIITERKILKCFSSNYCLCKLHCQIKCVYFLSNPFGSISQILHVILSICRFNNKYLFRQGVQVLTVQIREERRGRKKRKEKC